MKAAHSTLFLCFSLPLCAFGQEQANSGIHAISLSQQQYRETFEFENSTQNLNVSGPGFQYSYGQASYSVGFNYQMADDHKQVRYPVLDRQFSLMLETEGYGAFAQYYLGQAWLGISVQKSIEINEYDFASPNIAIKNQNEINTSNLSLDAGYGWYFERSQLSIYGQLSQQYNEEKTLYVESRDVLNIRSASQDSSLIDEEALLASITLDYGFYNDLSFINPDLQLATNMNVTHISSLSGNAHIQQNSRYNLPNSQLSQSAEELTVDNQQDSTRYGFQVSVQGMQNSVSFAMNIEDDQDMADAYFSVSVGTQF